MDDDKEIEIETNSEEWDVDETGTRSDAGTFECALIVFGAFCALCGWVLGIVLAIGGE